MSQLHEHVAQLKMLMKSLKHELSPFIDHARLKEKQSQLQFIENTIVQLQKSNTPVPEELRQLKFKLLKEMDAFSEALTIK